MSPVMVQKRLAAIEAVRSDPERAHALRDDLWRDVLLAIAEGNEWCRQELARLALTADRIEFPEWCA